MVITKLGGFEQVHATSDKGDAIQTTLLKECRPCGVRKRASHDTIQAGT